VAAWRATLPAWSAPEFTPPAKALAAEGMYHPLLADPVPNSIAIDGGGVLITGSNMSGKTTFVRALGVNAVLAQSLATACAATWRAPLLRVRTSITGGDSLADGKSYYLAEIEAVLALVRAKEGGHQHLFLLDELFRGTNTTERVAAAYAVLAHLDRGLDITVVATHDLELLGLLGGAYALQHFTETVSGDDLTFDYRIRPGPSTTRNAIALLKVMQYPEAIVARALALVDGRGDP
jgi:DNA mismatch repair ATPase MutS